MATDNDIVAGIGEVLYIRQKGEYFDWSVSVLQGTRTLEGTRLKSTSF